jgi:hypothetical protein
VILAGGPGLPDLAQHGVLVRRVGRGEVGKRGEDGVSLGAHRGLAIAQLATARRQLCEVLALLGRRGAATASACAILLGSQRLELGRKRAPLLVELEQTIDRVGQRRVAPAECLPDRVRIAADQPDVENVRPPPESSTGPTTTCGAWS